MITLHLVRVIQDVEPLSFPLFVGQGLGMATCVTVENLEAASGDLFFEYFDPGARELGGAGMDVDAATPLAASEQPGVRSVFLQMATKFSKVARSGSWVVGLLSQ